MSDTSSARGDRGRLSPDLRRPWRMPVPSASEGLPPLLRSATPPMISMLAPTTLNVIPVVLTPGSAPGALGLRGEFEDEVD